MKILITGGMGYIGTSMLEVFKNHQVTVVDNFLFGQEYLVPGLLARYENLNIIRTDLMDFSDNIIKQELKDTDVVIHLAALVGMPLCDSVGNSITYSVNTGATKRLVSLLSKNQKIIFPNTNSAYGTSPAGSVCTEDSPTKPISSYGVTKSKSEEIVLEHGNSCVFRLATVFGLSPRMRLDLMVNDFVYKAKFNNVLSIFEGHFRRNFVHVKDVCNAFRFSITDSLTGVYNLGLDSANMTKIELAKKISKFTGCKVEETPGKDPDQRDYLVSSQKLYKTGFKCIYELEYGIEELLEFYKNLPKDIVGRNRIIKGMKNYDNNKNSF